MRTFLSKIKSLLKGQRLC